jgi:Spy/CpxP family protein refolding chaperone
MRKLGRHLTNLSTCLLALSISACAGKQEPPPSAPAPIVSAATAPTPAPAPVAAPTTAPSTPPVTEIEPAPKPRFHHQGQHPIVEMIFAELSEVNLSPAQKTAVDSIEADLKKQTETIEAPKKQLDSDVADGASAGKIDKAKIEADLKKLTQSAESTTIAVQDAMNKLHKTLDTTQRKKLVEVLRAEAAKHHGHEHGTGPKSDAKGDEHHERDMGHKGNDEKQARHHEMARTEPGERLAAELGLTVEQREKLSKKLESELKANQANMKEHWGSIQKHLKTLLDDFEKDTFDAKKAGVGSNIGQMVKMMATGRIRFVETVLSVLTPEQRGKFADHIRQQADGRYNDGRDDN